MPSFQFTNEDVPQFELLKSGNYGFEVVGADVGISNSGKTNGCETLSLKVKFFSDKEFKKPLAQWTERLTFPQLTGTDEKTVNLNKFLNGVCNMFVKCTNMKAAPGQDITLDPSSVIGLRGVCNVTQVKNERSGEMQNRVKTWLTDKEKFPRNEPSKIDSEDANW